MVTTETLLCCLVTIVTLTGNHGNAAPVTGDYGNATALTGIHGMLLRCVVTMAMLLRGFVFILALLRCLVSINAAVLPGNYGYADALLVTMVALLGIHGNSAALLGIH